MAAHRMAMSKAGGRKQRWALPREERGAVVKDWGGKLPIALVYPNRYFLAMSNLGFQGLYRCLNQVATVVCERFVYPEAAELESGGSTRGLYSLESRRPLADFHLVAFSVAFENDYTNLVHLLELGNITLESARRRQHEPLVVAGGVATFLNPEPITPFVDLFLVGEAENLIHPFLQALEEFPGERRHRGDLLLYLAQRVPGAYVPALYRIDYLEDGRVAGIRPLAAVAPRVRVQVGPLPAGQQPVATAVYTPETEFPDTLLVEIGRGCGRGCRFCAAGFVMRPPRFYPARIVHDEIRRQRPPRPKVGLVSAAVSDHPEIGSLCQQLQQQGLGVSFSSLRADGLTPELVEAVRASGGQTVAIAPEAGTERLRRVINKNLTQEQIEAAVVALAAGGIVNLRLYFMVGLPTETDADIDGLISLVKRVQHLLVANSRRRGRLGTITVSLNCFVPKPWTPFQWHPFADLRALRQRLKKVKRALGRVANVRVHADLPKWAFFQALLSRGDRRVGGLLPQVVAAGGDWNRVLTAVNLNPNFYVYRQRQEDEIFPWEVLEHGVSRSYLWQEYQKGLRAEATAPCEPEKCRRCGVCPPAASREQQ